MLCNGLSVIWKNRMFFKCVASLKGQFTVESAVGPLESLFKFDLNVRISLYFPCTLTKA